MLKKILIMLAVVIALLAIVIGRRPGEFTVTREATIIAPPSVVYAQLADFHRWQRWSPWEQRDPNQKRTFSGPNEGMGAEYAWAGNKDVGEGRMRVVSARANEQVGVRLEFIKPFAGTNDVEFVLTPQGNGTHVTWAMRGALNFLTKALSIFKDMDTMIGPDFEQGLANLKRVSEAEAQKSAAPAPADRPTTATPTPAAP